jgi:hypothetical protein
MTPTQDYDDDEETPGEAFLGIFWATVGSLFLVGMISLLVWAIRSMCK